MKEGHRAPQRDNFFESIYSKIATSITPFFSALSFNPATLKNFPDFNNTNADFILSSIILPCFYYFNSVWRDILIKQKLFSSTSSKAT